MSQRGSEPIVVPTWAWARDDMATALGERKLGDVLRLAQKYSGASQSRLATATGLLQGRISELVRGTRSASTLEVFERVADGLGMPGSARVAMGLAPQDGDAPTPRVGEIAGVYASQSDALSDVRRCVRESPSIDLLAVRGLGLIGLSDSALRPALAAGATLRVLLLDPDSDAAGRRAAEIGESRASFTSGIKLALARLEELAEQRADLHVEARLYASLPTWRIIAPEPAIFVSSFGESHEGHRSTMYKLERTERPGSLWWGFRRFLAEHHRDARRIL